MAETSAASDGDLDCAQVVLEAGAIGNYGCALSDVRAAADEEAPYTVQLLDEDNTARYEVADVDPLAFTVRTATWTRPPGAGAERNLSRCVGFRGLNASWPHEGLRRWRCRHEQPGQLMELLTQYHREDNRTGHHEARDPP